MKTLYVSRHATAELHAASGQDFDRRLADRGEREAHQVAQRALALGWGLDLIVASPAARTLATATAYAQTFALGDPQMRTAMTLYSTEQGYLSDLFEALPNQTDRILIVGHNPVISGLGRWLADGADFPEFEPAHAAVFRIDVAHWRDIHPSLAVLTARLSPGG